MSLKKNVVANYIGSGWSAAMNLIFIPYYIQYLGMEAYGLIGFYAILQTFLALLDMGMTPTLSREMARFTGGEHSPSSIRNLLRSIEMIAAAIALIYVSCIFFASDWFANNWLQVDKLPISVVIKACISIGLVTALRFIEGLYRSALIGLQRQVIVSFINSIMATLRGGGAVLVLIFIEPSINAYFLWQAVISIITVIIFVIIVYSSIPKSKIPTTFSKAELEKVWRFAAGLMVTTFSAICLTQVDKLILSKLLSLSQFGNYSLITTVSGVLIMMTTPIIQAYLPKLAELQSQNKIEAIKLVFHRGAQLITVVSGTGACMLILFGHRIMYLWTSNNLLVDNMGNLLRVMALGTFTYCLIQMPYILQLAYGCSSFSAKTYFVSVFFLMPAILLVTPVYGPIGAASIWLTLNIVHIIAFTYFTFNHFLCGERLKWLLNDIIIPLILAVVTVSICWFLRPIKSNMYAEIFYILFTGAFVLIMSIIGASELRIYAYDKFFKKH